MEQRKGCLPSPGAVVELELEVVLVEAGGETAASNAVVGGVPQEAGGLDELVPR